MCVLPLCEFDREARGRGCALGVLGGGPMGAYGGEVGDWVMLPAGALGPPSGMSKADILSEGRGSRMHKPIRGSLAGRAIRRV